VKAPKTVQKTQKERRENMKYMLLMSATKEVFEWYSKWPQDDLQRNIAFMRNFNKELKESGVLVGTAGLAFPDQAKIVKAGKNGEPITDGVFPESKEFLAGYWIIDVENAEEAYKIAARASLAPAPAGTPDTMPIEVREVMSKASEACGD
jgi:hypothetical protein